MACGPSRGATEKRSRTATIAIAALLAEGTWTIGCGAQVIAVDATSGALVGATIGGWTCTAPGPAQFDGTYEIDGLTVGHSYTVYVGALNGAVDPSQFDNAVVSPAGIRLAIRAGRRCLDAWCLRWTRALRQGLGRGLRMEFSVFSFSL